MIANTENIPKQGKKILWSISIVASLFLMFGVYLFNNSELNISIFLFLNALFSILPPSLVSLITLFGDTFVGFITLFLIFKKYRKKFIIMALATLPAAIIVGSLKHTINAPRPPLVLDIQDFTIIGEAYTQNSFPSGHTATGFVVCTIIFLLMKSSGGWLAVFIPAFFIGLSRIAVGIHWPSDVLAGAGLGILLAVASFLCLRFPFWKHLDIERPLKAAILYLILGILMAIHDPGYTMFFIVRAVQIGLVIWLFTISAGYFLEFRKSLSDRKAA